MIHVQFDHLSCALGVLGLGGCYQPGRAPPAHRSQAHTAHPHVNQNGEASSLPCQFRCNWSIKTWHDSPNPVQISMQNVPKLVTQGA